ncbi:hypothetical protein [Anthocerotibacter panamensis]|uniref:hypothetical protein n=1 Tax=Anthocerotibacter panamensis TaxID=2857077 RepID=UPI001C405E69|nr:hypothetical protein [Anthocerotibacter panamensis]
MKLAKKLALSSVFVAMIALVGTDISLSSSTHLVSMAASAQTLPPLPDPGPVGTNFLQQLMSLLGSFIGPFITPFLGLLGGG